MKSSSEDWRGFKGGYDIGSVVLGKPYACGLFDLVLLLCTSVLFLFSENSGNIL